VGVAARLIAVKRVGTVVLEAAARGLVMALELELLAKVLMAALTHPPRRHFKVVAVAVDRRGQIAPVLIRKMGKLAAMELLIP
jgi:hypothetical protein